jgi:hypothetical protein
MSLAEELGFSPTDRVAVIHVDDVGMCHSTLRAYDDLAALGVVSSASTMVPCSWFPAVARRCRQDPAADMGIHLTLNSEWDDYRWHPLTEAVSLRDDLGYFKRYPEMTFERIDAPAVHAELKAQMDRALGSGIDVTHIDTHILALRHPDLVSTYLDLSRQYRVPCSVVRRPDTEMERNARSPSDVEAYYRMIDEAEAEGIPLFDTWIDLPLRRDLVTRIDAASRALDALPRGVSAVVMHPAVDSPELRAAAEDWEGRVADLNLLRSPAWPRALERAGIKTVGMRAIRDVLRRRIT